MTDVMKTCASCGNTQTTGDFCEKCGNRLATPAAEVAAPAYGATYPTAPAPGTYQPGPYQAQPSGYQPQPGAYAPPPGAYPPGAAPYAYAAQPQYAPPREPGPWDKLFDLSFQGFVTPATLKVLYFILLGAIGVFLVFSIVWGFMFTGTIGAMWLFASIAIAAFLFFMTRIVFELVATTLRVRDNTEKAEEKSQPES